MRSAGLQAPTPYFGLMSILSAPRASRTRRLAFQAASSTNLEIAGHDFRVSGIAAQVLHSVLNKCPKNARWCRTAQ